MIMVYKDFLEKSDIEKGWIIAAFTDEYIVDRWPMEQSISLEALESKALEIRIFNETKEKMLSRSDIGKDFSYREIDDSNVSEDKYYDEIQFLDVDETVGKIDGKVTATGGGRYYLPLDKIKDAKIRIRYYVDRYPGSGQARIADWRAVELMEG